MKSTHSTIYLDTSLFPYLIINPLFQKLVPNKHWFLPWIKSHDFTSQEIIWMLCNVNQSL